jgi:hypothetical protein
MTADDYALGIRNGWLAGKAPRGSRFEQNSRNRSIITSAGSPARRSTVVTLPSGKPVQEME